MDFIIYLTKIFPGNTTEREKKRKGFTSSGSVLHWSDFQLSSSESTNRLMSSQKALLSSPKFYKLCTDSSPLKADSSSRIGNIPGSEHTYHPPPEEHPPPVSMNIVSTVTIKNTVAYFRYII